MLVTEYQNFNLFGPDNHPKFISEFEMIDSITAPSPSEVVKRGQLMYIHCELPTCQLISEPETFLFKYIFKALGEQLTGIAQWVHFGPPSRTFWVESPSIGIIFLRYLFLYSHFIIYFYQI